MRASNRPGFESRSGFIWPCISSLAVWLLSSAFAELSEVRQVAVGGQGTICITDVIASRLLDVTARYYTRLASAPPHRAPLFTLSQLGGKAWTGFGVQGNMGESLAHGVIRTWARSSAATSLHLYPLLWSQDRQLGTLCSRNEEAFCAAPLPYDCMTRENLP
jgi:hypothetical protein